MRIRYTHYRRAVGYDGPSLYPADIQKRAGFDLEPRGGRTEARVVDDRGRVLAVGYAHCSDTDPFCKETGRRIARSRLPLPMLVACAESILREVGL